MATEQQPYAAFCERFEVDQKGISIVGWALRRGDFQPPQRFELVLANRKFELRPNAIREDVGRLFATKPAMWGVSQFIPLELSPHEEWAPASFAAHWEDGKSIELSNLKNAEVDLRSIINFKTFTEFDKNFQNPAFRRTSSLLQAYGAARAMRISGDDLNFWLAGLVVGTYRCIEQNVFRKSEVEAGLVKWDEIQLPLRQKATGVSLRWATSMHLAAGYAYLAWGNPVKARQEFAAMNDYADRLSTWPQSLTNLGIGRFMAAWMAIQTSERAMALEILAGTEDMFQKGTGPLKIWNFHMYEELRGALKVWQYCFVLKKYLEGETAAHILPPNFTFALGSVSVVLGRLMERGLAPRWRFPQDIPAVPEAALKV